MRVPDWVAQAEEEAPTAITATFPAPVTSVGRPPYTRVNVWYATDRAPTGSTAPNDFYGHARGDGSPPGLGVCEVSVPDDHRIAEIERPHWWRLEFSEDPARHIVILSTRPQTDDAFFASLRTRTAAAPPREQAFVFIHGYNVAFDESIRRTAQLAYDLQFKGAAIAYSWPAEDNPLRYTVAEGNALWSVPHLQAFLLRLTAESGARTIHLIGHSLGNRIMADALDRIAIVAADRLPMFQEVVLTAPDIDLGVFKQIAAAVKKTAGQVTIYVSSRDEALVASARLHAFARVGLAPPNPLVVDGVDTIDASSVTTSFLGHSYAQDTTTVLSDLFPLIKDGKRAADRFWLRPTPAGYFEFRRGER